MKKLLESYKSIIENSHDNTNVDLASDMIKFNMNFTAKAKLIPLESKEERKYCKDCGTNVITFKSGAFCQVCGYIFPF